MNARNSAQEYARRLRDYPHKGEVDLEAQEHERLSIEHKVRLVAEWIRNARVVVVHTGAGLSTPAGIPDFRSKYTGVWSNLSRPSSSPTTTAQLWPAAAEHRLVTEPPSPVSSAADGEADGRPFERAVPTYSHLALAKLVELGLVHYIITQNVDGLHERSGVPRDRLAVLHGCVFAERCLSCGAHYFRDWTMTTVGGQPTGRRCRRSVAATAKPTATDDRQNSCTAVKTEEEDDDDDDKKKQDQGRVCGGELVDHVLDWEDPLPEQELERAVNECRRSDVSLILGTSLQMNPARRLFLHTLDNPTGGRAVLCNLSATPMDGQVTACLRTYCDHFMALLMHALLVDQPLSWRRCVSIGPGHVQPAVANQLWFLFARAQRRKHARLRFVVRPDVDVVRLHDCARRCNDSPPSASSSSSSSSSSSLQLSASLASLDSSAIVVEVDEHSADEQAPDEYFALEADRVTYDLADFARRYCDDVAQQRLVTLLALQRARSPDQLRQWFVKDVSLRNHWQCVLCLQSGVHTAARRGHLQQQHFAAAVVQRLNIDVRLDGKRLHSLLQHVGNTGPAALLEHGFSLPHATAIHEQLVGLLDRAGDDRPSKRSRR